MIPQTFPEQNVIFAKPQGWTDEECGPLPVFLGNGIVVSAWKPTPSELVRLNLGEPVWLTIAGLSMPPVALGCDSPFDPVSPYAETY